MPLGVKPCCATCKTTDSTMWRKNKKGYIQCNSCGLKDLPPANGNSNGNGSSTTQGKNGSNQSCQSGNGGKGREGTRKSSRNVKKQRYKQMVTAGPKNPSTKGKSRRIIFKRNVSVASPTQSGLSGRSTSVGQLINLGESTEMTLVNVSRSHCIMLRTE